MTSLYNDIIWANTAMEYAKLKKPIRSSHMNKVYLGFRWRGPLKKFTRIFPITYP